MSKKQELLSKAAKLEKQIKAGKIHGKAKLKKARWQVCNYRWRAKKFDKNQGYLPGFLNQMPIVRMEELVAQATFEKVKYGRVRTSTLKQIVEVGAKAKKAV